VLTWTAMTARARAGTAGDAPYSGAALGRDLRCGSPPVAARRRPAPSHPQAGSSAGNAPRWPCRASWAGPSSTRRASCHRAKITVKGARCAHVATPMALRAILECDLPRQDLGTYQRTGEDRNHYAAFRS
jgi:hypothetical protein